MLASFARTSIRFNALSVRAFSTGNRVLGSVKWFDHKKGFGFISHDSGDVFVHQSQIQSDGFRSLLDGENVEFEIVQDEAKQRTNAKNVTAPGGQALSSSRLPRRTSSNNQFSV